MDVLEIINKVIEDVTYNKTSLKEALKMIKDTKRDNILIVTKFTSLYFRNYYLIKSIAHRFKIKPDSKEFISLGILFINNAFYEIKEKALLYADFLTLIISLKYNLSKEDLELFSKIVNEKRNYLFEDVTRGSIEYHSIRFNKPKWLIKMILNQYGRKNGLDELYEMNKMPKQFVSPYLNKEFNVSEKYDAIINDLYLFKSEKSIRKEDDFFKENIFLIQYALYEVVSKLPSLNESTISIILNDDSTIIYQLIKHYVNKNNKINIYLMNKEKNKKNYNKLLEIKKMKDLNIVYNDKNDFTFETIENNNKLLVYHPLSSNFELYRKNPEYSYLFEFKYIENMIKRVKEELPILLNKLDIDGELVFVSPTLNLNETYYLVHDILNLSDNKFIIKKEHLYVPTSNENSILYYALIRRNNA